MGSASVHAKIAHAASKLVLVERLKVLFTVVSMHLPTTPTNAVEPSSSAQDNGQARVERNSPNGVVRS